MRHKPKRYCVARWFARGFTGPERPLCHVVAHGEMNGYPLCWVHMHTVTEGMATLEQVLNATRGPCKFDHSGKARADGTRVG